MFLFKPLKAAIKRKYFVFFLISLFLILGTKFSLTHRYFLTATFNEFFTPWDFKWPEKGGNFYVRHGAPRVMVRIIERAFPEYKIVFINQDDSQTPHLILKEYYTPTKSKHATHAPYLGYSGEQENLRWKRYLPSGYPFMEFVSCQKTSDNFIFIPFIVYGKTNLRQLFGDAIQERKQNAIRPLQVAYISSHCIKEREEMFALLRERFGDQAISLGKCSRTPGYEAAGAYWDLKGIYKGYNFVLTMENHDRKGYLTEKISNAFEAGAIPIYWGDSDLARLFFNPDSFIDMKQYKNFRAAADGVFEIANNPDKLQKMLKAPLFKDNKIPPFLLINDDVLTAEEEAILQEMARTLRKNYEDYLEHKRQLRPYWKALDLLFLLKEKWTALF